jgi:hypothetical protein
MILNGKLRDFVGNASAKGQVTLGDVRRLQRGYLPGGITSREELEILISLNAKLVRADKAWAQWLLSVIADFVATREACEPSIEDAAGKWVERLLAASATKVGQRIARQIRRELWRLRASQSSRPAEGLQRTDVQPAQVRASEHDTDDGGLEDKPRAEPSRCKANESPARLRRQCPAVRVGTDAISSAPPGWSLATCLRNLQRSHLMNFQSAWACPVLAPCY